MPFRASGIVERGRRGGGAQPTSSSAAWWAHRSNARQRGVAAGSAPLALREAVSSRVARGRADVARGSRRRVAAPPRRIVGTRAAAPRRGETDGVRRRRIERAARAPATAARWRAVARARAPAGGRSPAWRRRGWGSRRVREPARSHRRISSRPRESGGAGRRRRWRTCDGCVAARRRAARVGGGFARAARRRRRGGAWPRREAGEGRRRRAVATHSRWGGGGDQRPCRPRGHGGVEEAGRCEATSRRRPREAAGPRALVTQSRASCGRAAPSAGERSRSSSSRASTAAGATVARARGTSRAAATRVGAWRMDMAAAGRRRRRCAVERSARRGNGERALRRHARRRRDEHRRRCTRWSPIPARRAGAARRRARRLTVRTRGCRIGAARVASRARSRSGCREARQTWTAAPQHADARRGATVRARLDVERGGMVTSPPPAVEGTRSGLGAQASPRRANVPVEARRSRRGQRGARPVRRWLTRRRAPTSCGVLELRLEAAQAARWPRTPRRRRAWTRRSLRGGRRRRWRAAAHRRRARRHSAVEQRSSSRAQCANSRDGGPAAGHAARARGRRSSRGRARAILERPAMIETLHGARARRSPELHAAVGR